MNDTMCELEFQGCTKVATYHSTVQTANYRESSYFCEDHKDAGYVPGVKLETTP